MARQDHSPVTDEQRATFLETLADGGSVTESAAAAGRKRQTFYRLSKTDAEFAAEWADAWSAGADPMIDEARRRAVEGVTDVKMIGAGDNAERVEFSRHSDVLLMFLIKQRDPSYRENAKLEVTGSGGGPVQVEHRGVKLADVLNVARQAGLEPGD